MTLLQQVLSYTHYCYMFSREAEYTNVIVIGLFLPVLKLIYHIRVHSHVVESMQAVKSFLGDTLGIFVGLTHGNIPSTQERTVQIITISTNEKHLLNITLLTNDVTYRLKSPLQKFYGHHHDLVDRYKISMYQMKMDIFLFTQTFSCRLFSLSTPVCSTK